MKNNFGSYNAARKAIVKYTGVTWKTASNMLKLVNSLKGNLKRK